MAFNMGIGARVGIGKESVWGTPVADTMLINFTSESMDASASKTEEESLLAGKAPAAFDLVGVKVAGDISAILKPENAGFFLKAALGGTDTVSQNHGGVTGQHQHTIIAAAAAGVIPSYTVIVDRKQAIKRYAGCKVDTLKLSAKVNDYVRVSLSFKGRDESVGTIATASPPTLKAYKFINGTLTMGAVNAEITGVDLDYMNNMDDGVQTNLTGILATEPLHGKRKISLSIEMPDCADAQTIRDTYLLAEAVLSTVVLHLESPAIIAGASKYRMDITFNNVAITEAKVNVGGPGLLSMAIKAEATAVGSTEPIQAVIYDGQSAAY